MARETSEIFAAPRSLPENFDVSLGENDRSTIGYCLENNSRRSLTLSLPDRKSAILVVKQQSMYRNVVSACPNLQTEVTEFEDGSDWFSEVSHIKNCQSVIMML